MKISELLLIAKHLESYGITGEGVAIPNSVLARRLGEFSFFSADFDMEKAVSIMCFDLGWVYTTSQTYAATKYTVFTEDRK